MATVENVDYLVVGAGAAGMAFTDALIDHSNVRVALVDRRSSVGGHWQEAYPFVRLHQASAFYGVASTLLGDGELQPDGPEAGLHERATAPEICAYYTRVLERRLLASGRVDFHPNCDYLGDRTIVSRISGKRFAVSEGCRIVDARYLSPRIPAETPPPFGVAEGARVIPVNDLVRVEAAASQYVVVGSGKTATDACIWLLANGVDPDAIRWVRPRDPWMLNRAVVQPNPAIFLGMAADTFEAATVATSLDDLFLRLEESGVMLRIDRTVTPTMARTPTLATWELDQLRTISDVVRLGHLQHVESTRLVCDDGEAALARDAIVVHCAADGLPAKPLVPIWGPGTITLQPVRAGFPCFAAALIGYLEATRVMDDAAKNRVCPPSPYPNSLSDWARMQVLGGRASAAVATDPDLRAWSRTVALNPAAIPPGTADSPELADAKQRLGEYGTLGRERLAELAGIA